MKIILIFTLIMTAHSFVSTNQLQSFDADHSSISYMGRVDFSNPKKPKIAASGVTINFKFKGSTLIVLLTDQNLWGTNYDYISVIVDGTDQGRMKITKDKKEYVLVESLENKIHTLSIVKSTEASVGWIEFSGIKCEELLSPDKVPKRKIEFIGNSITCGMAMITENPKCFDPNWFDNHDAYNAYGSTLARKLNSQWMLSSVSGIGMLRNWNGVGPTMPEVYKSIYFNLSDTTDWDFKNYVPDLVSICLGTNDFSDGDKPTPRALPDSAKFVGTYLTFMKMLFEKYPNAKFILLSSPTVDEPKKTILNNYLKIISANFNQLHGVDKSSYYFYKKLYINGCNWHPNSAEHKEMADELEPIFKNVMGW